MATKIKRPLKWLFPSTISKEYQRLLLRMVREWEDEAKILIIPRLPSIVDSANSLKNPIASDIISDSINNDDWVDDIKVMMAGFAKKIKDLVPTSQTLSNIANKVSTAKGMKVARTSLKFRNEKNQPDAWEVAVLEQFEQRKVKGEPVVAPKPKFLPKFINNWQYH